MNNDKKLTNALLIVLIGICAFILVMVFNLNVKLTEIQNLPAVVISEKSTLDSTDIFDNLEDLTEAPYIENIVPTESVAPVETENSEDIAKESTEEITEEPDETVKNEVETSAKEISSTSETTTAKITTTTDKTTTQRPTTSKPATTQKSQDSSDYCYVTNSGTKYHREGCSYLSKSKTRLTLSEAQASGYSPCSRCY